MDTNIKDTMFFKRDNTYNKITVITLKNKKITIIDSLLFHVHVYNGFKLQWFYYHVIWVLQVRRLFQLLL